MAPPAEKALTLPPPEVDILGTELFPIGKSNVMSLEGSILQAQNIAIAVMLQDIRARLPVNEGRRQTKASRKRKSQDTEETTAELDEAVVASLIDASAAWTAGSTGRPGSLTYKKLFTKATTPASRKVALKWFVEVAHANEAWTDDQKLAYFEKVSQEVLDGQQRERLPKEKVGSKGKARRTNSPSPSSPKAKAPRLDTASQSDSDSAEDESQDDEVQGSSP